MFPSDPSRGIGGEFALVTGAGGLLGYHHCSALLSEGLKVIALDSDLIKLDTLSERLAQWSQRLVPIQVDLLNQDSIKELFEYTNKLNQPVRYLVNNAAINPSMTSDSKSQSGLLETFERDEFLLECELGLAAVVYLARFYGSKMAESGGGAILNIASDLAVIAPDQRLYQDNEENLCWSKAKPISYSIVKHGLLGITKYLSTYWLHKNVRCNSLSPGGVLNGQHPDLIDRLSSRIPLGRMASCDEYEGIIQFLCSDKARYVNGQNIVADGGRSVW